MHEHNHEHEHHEHHHEQHIDPAHLLEHMYEHNETHTEELKQVAEMLDGSAKEQVLLAAAAFESGNAELCKAIAILKEA